jgi:hypothetical protein
VTDCYCAASRAAPGGESWGAGSCGGCWRQWRLRGEAAPPTYAVVVAASAYSRCSKRSNCDLAHALVPRCSFLCASSRGLSLPRCLLLFNGVLSISDYIDILRGWHRSFSFLHICPNYCIYRSLSCIYVPSLHMCPILHPPVPSFLGSAEPLQLNLD